ncbi:hypothetical protein [Streptomyces lavendulae]
MPLAEQALAARVRLLGGDHPRTDRARAILAAPTASTTLPTRRHRTP